MGAHPDQHITFEGMEVRLPDERRMLALYRSGTLLNLFNTQACVKQYFKGWDVLKSMRMMEDTSMKYRVIPVRVSITLYEEKKK